MDEGKAGCSGRRVTTNRKMSADEALSRLANACGGRALDQDSACWEIEALKRAGWTASIVLSDNGINIVLEAPPKKTDD